MKRILVCSDSHGDLIDKDAKNKVLQWRNEYKWDEVFHLGDFLDLRPLRKGASQEERAEGIKDDYNAAIEFLDELKPTHLLFGNHDQRLVDLAQKGSPGIEKEHAQHYLNKLLTYLSTNKLKIHPYHVKDNVVSMYGIQFVHGFRSSAVNPAKMLWEEYGNAVCGHVHKPDFYQSRRWNGEKAYTLPMLAYPFMGFNSRQVATLGHVVGFAHLEVLPKKSGKHNWQAHHIMREDGRWLTGQNLEKI